MVDPALAQPEITVAAVGEDTAVVSVRGELDVGSADELRAALGELSGAGTTVVVDLVGTSFIDSTALGIISGAAKALKQGGGTLAVVATDPRIIRIFTLTGLDRSIRMERSLAQAISYALA